MHLVVLHHHLNPGGVTRVVENHLLALATLPEDQRPQRVTLVFGGRDQGWSHERMVAKLRDVSARFFLQLNGASFGRCDLRVDREGTPYMLEINPNCGVYYPETDPGSADLILRQDPAGHEGFTRQIVAAAFERHGS